VGLTWDKFTPTRRKHLQISRIISCLGCPPDLCKTADADRMIIGGCEEDKKLPSDSSFTVASFHVFRILNRYNFLDWTV